MQRYIKQSILFLFIVSMQSISGIFKGNLKTKNTFLNATKKWKLLQNNFSLKSKKNNILFESIIKNASIMSRNKYVVGGILVGSGLYAKYCFSDNKEKFSDISSDTINIKEIIEEDKKESLNEVLAPHTICAMDQHELDQQKIVDYIFNHFSDFKIDEVADLIKKSEKLTEVIKHYIIENLFTCIEKTYTRSEHKNGKKYEKTYYYSVPLFAWSDLQKLFPDQNEQDNLHKAALEKYLGIPFSTNGPYTQSEAHIVANYKARNSDGIPYVYNKVVGDKNLPLQEQRKYFLFLQKILKEERMLAEKNPNAIFLYHALQPRLLWPKIVKTVMYATKYNKPMHNFLLAGHESNKDPHHNALVYNEGKAKRKQLMAWGLGRYTSEKDIHYTNGAILGNLFTWQSSSTWDLLIRNSNCTGNSKILDEQDIAEQFGITLSEDLKIELQACREKFLKEAQYSFLLRWRISSKVAKKAVYTAFAEGIKRAVHLKYSIFKSDASTILHAIRKDPHCIWDSPIGGYPYSYYADTIEYPIVLTPDTTRMFQKYGVKIDIVSINDHKLLEKYVEELISIVKKIQQKYPEQLTSKCSYEEEITHYKKK